VVQESLGCIKGLPYPLCDAFLGNSDYFLPPFHIHLFFFLHPNSEKNSFCPYLSYNHNSRSTHPKFLFVKPKLWSKRELSAHFEITSIGVLQPMGLTFLPYWLD